MYYDLMKNHIAKGGYKMLDMKDKIAKLWTEGQLDDSQREELNFMVENGVSTDAERPAVMDMLFALSARIDDLVSRISALENGAGTETPADEYEVWVPWDGISNKHQKDAIVKHHDKLWISTFSGQNVWEPGAIGTENVWRLYEGEAM